VLYDHHSLIKPDNWPHRWFSPRELASKGAGSLLVNHDAISRLDELRERMGQPIIVTSAYRDPIHNARVGGAPKSLHKQGRAFDIRLAGHDKWRLYRMAQDVGFTGFGFYNTFLHVDTGHKRSWGEWQS